MRRIITFGCFIGGLILAAIVFMILLGAGYKELIGLTILQVVYLVGFSLVILIYSMKNISETKNNEKIPVKVDEYEEKINYIIKNEDFDRY